MRLLRLIVKASRWYIATHTIILATVRILNIGKLQATKKEAPQRAMKKLGSTASTIWS